MYKLVILELYEHDEVLSYLCQVLASEVQLTVIASREVLTLTEYLPKQHFTIDPAENKANTIRKLSHHWQENDFVIVVTSMLEYQPWEELTKHPIKKILLVHNSSWLLSLKPAWQAWRIDHALRRLKWWAKGYLKKRKHIAVLFDGLVFPSPNIQQNFAQVMSVPQLGISWAIWCSARPAPLKRDGSGPYSLVVPGAVDTNRRNYRVLLDAITLLADRLPALQFVLLGKLVNKQGKLIAENFRQALAGKGKVLTFSHYIAKDIYEQYLAEADVLIALQGAETPFATSIELGGQTKISGVENDQIRHGKRLWQLRGYQSLPELSDHTEHFSNAAELAELILSMSYRGSAESGKTPESLNLAYQQNAWLDFFARVQGASPQA